MTRLRFLGVVGGAETEGDPWRDCGAWSIVDAGDWTPLVVYGRTVGERPRTGEEEGANDMMGRSENCGIGCSKDKGQWEKMRSSERADSKKAV